MIAKFAAYNSTPLVVAMYILTEIPALRLKAYLMLEARCLMIMILTSFYLFEHGE